MKIKKLDKLQEKKSSNSLYIVYFFYSSLL